MNFYEQLNRNDAVRKVFDTAEFVGEFIDLEEQYHLLKTKVDFYPFYKNLLQRIGEYSEYNESSSASGDDKIALSYLFAAVLSKINSLKEGNETDLIIDIEKYFDVLKTEVDLIQDIENAVSKANAIDRLKKEYKYRIDRKIEEATYFIENTINPEINKISKAIDNKIDILIKEMTFLQKEVLREKNEFEKKKKELEDAITLKKVFDVLKSLGRIANFFGTYGKAASDIIELSTSVGEHFSLNNEVDSPDVTTAAAKLSEIENNFQIMRNEKTEYLYNVFNELSEKIEQYPEELLGMSIKLTEMKNRLDEILTSKLHFFEIKKLEQDFKDMIREKEMDFEGETTVKSPLITEMLKKLINTIEVGSVFVDIRNKNQEDDKMSAINDAIQQKRLELIILREFEEQIYEIVRPALENVKNMLHVFSNDSIAKSQVSLDVDKWNVQRILNDIKIQMLRVNDIVEVKTNLSLYVEKFEEAISLLITIYERIQRYQDEQILSNHIANVCSFSASTLSPMSQNLVNVTRHLETSIIASLAYKNYQTALNAFKQWVFPFSLHYLEGPMISAQFQPGGRLHNLVFNAAKEIQDLKKKIGLYKASAKHTDEFLIHAEFNSRSVSGQPFFVWKDEQYRSEISGLLSGEAIALKADVQLSEPGKDAIKFNLIKLNFKSRNETIQSRLDDTLKAFDVSATHIGNSYYRYEEEIHLITSPKRTLVYSFEENSRSGDPLRENEVYRKIKNGDLMLSPYTMWIFKLDVIQKGSFQDLDIYKGEIDLELEGKGIYVRNNFFYEDSDFAVGSHLETAVDSQLNFRAVRSLDKRGVQDIDTASSSALSISSPINIMCSLLKIYTISLITDSLHKIIDYGSGTLKIYDNTRSFPAADVCKELQQSGKSNISQDFILKRIDATDELKFTSKESRLKSNDMLSKYHTITNFGAASKRIFCNDEVNAFIFNEQGSNFYNQSVQVPNMSHSLLLADFIARSYTGVKYETVGEESLMSVKQVISNKCNELSIKNENDITQNFRLIAQTNENVDISFFSSIKRGVKSVFKFLGIISKEKPEEYIRDIRNLFV